MKTTRRELRTTLGVSAVSVRNARQVVLDGLLIHQFRNRDATHELIVGPGRTALRPER